MYTLELCDDLQKQCADKDPSQMQAVQKDDKCSRLAGSAVKNKNKFSYLSKEI